MVMSPEPPPSRAGSLPLIADDLALDFANTESGRGFPSHQNHLREAANVVDWLRHAKALPAEDADWLAKRVAERADLAADLLARAIELRAAIQSAWRERSGAAPSRPRRRSPAFPLCTRDLSLRPSLRRAISRAAGAGACARRLSKPRLARSRSPRSGCSPRAIFTGSGNAAVTPAAGCSMIAARTTAGGGAKWRSAAIAPSSGGSRRGDAGLEGSPGHWPHSSPGRRDARRLLAGAGDGPGAALPHGAAGAHGRRDRGSPFSSQTPDAGRARLERRLHRRGARREARASSRRLPLSRAGTAARVPRSHVAHARRPSPSRKRGSSFSSATGWRRRRAGRPIRRRSATSAPSPSRRAPSPTACRWRWTDCRWRRSMRCWLRPIRWSTA